MSNMGSVTGLFIYPVKSCGAISLSTAKCELSGFRWDREWVLHGREGKALTQRDVARMALIGTHVEDAGDASAKLTLNFPDRAPLVVSGNFDGERLVTDVWGTGTAGRDEGAEAAAWLSDALSTPVRLARRDFAESRLSRIAMPSGQYAPLSYFDGMPLLVVSEESLDDLNQQIEGNGGAAVPMSRFRPSIVLRGLGAFAEDNANMLRVGNIIMHRGKPCARCVITTIDQATAIARGPEPLRTLSKYRQQGEKVMFGTYFMPEAVGEIRVGDVAEILN